MHQRYAPDGLVCMSVSVDEVGNKDKALKFLQERQADFGNYLLDEDTEVWQNKWKITATPAVFVFDRDGKLARQFDSEDPDHPFDYTDVEPLVRKLLKEKP